MKQIYLIIILCFLFGCSGQVSLENEEIEEIEHFPVERDVPIVEREADNEVPSKDVPIEEREVDKELPTVEDEAIDLTLFEREPTEWGEDVTGVKNRFHTDKMEIALTFDACGGPTGNGYDEELIRFLRDANVPATLFINERWIVENEAIFIDLADDPLFQIENHGTAHCPLSVNGGEAWGIAATASVEEVMDEIMENADTVRALTGDEMTLFRSGTAFYDEVAVELANELGYEVVNFDILGDAGATFSSTQVKNALLSAESGSIALLHMNQPTSGTASGVIEAIPLLEEQGYEFVLLDGKELE